MPDPNPLIYRGDRALHPGQADTSPRHCPGCGSEVRVSVCKAEAAVDQGESTGEANVLCRICGQFNSVRIPLDR